MIFDINTNPFSYKGSFWAFNTYIEDGKEKLYLKNVRESCSFSEYKLFEINAFYFNKSVDFKCKASPEKLILSAENWCAAIYFSDEDTFCIYTSDANIAFSFTLCSKKGYSYFYEKTIDNINYTILNLPPNRINIAINAQNGKISYLNDKNELSFLISGDERGILISLSEFEVELLSTLKNISPEYCIENAKLNFKTFMDSMLPTPKEEVASRTLASYILWSCHVKKSRFLPHEAVYMSKNDMCNIWSWDNCMIAIALSYGQIKTAINQLLIPLEYQDTNGAIPDYVNDVFCLHNFCKPPIYGWALNKIKHNHTFENETLMILYNKIEKNTNWWFNYRDSDNDNVCEYLHGNDSGWDNSTLFLGTPPVETPDLQTFLILQMDFLIDCCEKFNFEKKKEYWINKQKLCINAMIEHCFIDDFSVAKQNGTHKITNEKSLICFIPLMLGERLPLRIRKKLLHELIHGDYITEYGLATEPLTSKYYNENGYWRGPIWGISTLMVTEGLGLCGEHELAKEIANKFIKLVAKSGMAENFNAVTGQPLKDKAFTWTSACYFYISNKYMHE